MSEQKSSWLDDAVPAGDASVGKLKILLYGDPGTGKTHAGATLPQPSLHLLSETHGDLTVKRVAPSAHIIYIKNYNHLLRILDGLAHDEHPYQSVCMDSITDMAKMVKRNFKGDKIGAKIALQDWGAILEMTEDIILKFRDLDVHVCVIALDDDKDDEGRVMHGPAITGKKLPKRLPAHFNIVGYQTKRANQDDPTKPAEHRTVLRAGDKYITKHHPALNPVEEPDIAAWVDKINAYGEGTITEEVKTQARDLDPEEEAQAAAGAIAGHVDVKAMFDYLRAPKGKRIATARKYGTLEKTLKALTELVETKKARETKEAS